MKSFSSYKLNHKRLIFCLTALYMSVIIFFASISYKIVSQDIKKQLGTKAMILAIDISSRTQLTSLEFHKLKNMEFKDAFKNQLYIDFVDNCQKLIEESNKLKYSEIVYVYLQSPLDNDEVKYHVKKNEESLYERISGTVLDTIYILDSEPWSIVKKGYSDKVRYDVTDNFFTETFEYKKPAYVLADSTWGEYITAYAPFHTVEGEYVGLIGVDLSLSSYNDYRKDVLKFILLFCISLILIGIYALYLIIKVNITKDEVMIERHIANMDGLTQVFNRRGFMEKFEQAWSKCLKDELNISLLTIDIDHFKKYNDILGHLKGDEVLISVSDILKESTRDTNGFIGRYGGDEFMIGIENYNSVESKLIAEKILENLKQFNINYGETHDYSNITVSIGIASLIPTDDVKKEDLFKYSDEALYRAKNLGRNCFYA